MSLIARREDRPAFAATPVGAQIGRGVAQPGRALSSGGRGRRFESSLPDQFLAYCRFCTVSSCKLAHKPLNSNYAAMVFPLSIAASVPSALARTRPPWTLATSYFGTRWFFIRRLAEIFPCRAASLQDRRRGSRTNGRAERPASCRGGVRPSDRGCGRFLSAPRVSPLPVGHVSR